MIERYQTSPDPIFQLKQSVLAAAENLAPFITLDGSELVGPQTLTLEPQEYAEGLDVRLQVERAIATKAVNLISTWAVGRLQKGCI